MNLLFEFKLAIRRLLKAPLTSLAAILMLTLGSSICFIVYIAWEVQVLKGPPINNAKELSIIWPQKGLFYGSKPITLDIAEKIKSEQDAYSKLTIVAQTWLNFTTDEISHRPSSSYVSPEFFDVFEVEPTMGRKLLPKDEKDESELVVVIAHSLWQQLKQHRDKVIGSWANIHGVPHKIVGVMPESFRHPVRAELWIPTKSMRNTVVIRCYLVGMLKSGTSFKTAKESINRILHPNYDIDTFREDESFKDKTIIDIFSLIEFNGFGDKTEKYSYIVHAILLAILVLIAMNIAILLITRNSEYAQEIALFQALGAPKSVLIKRVMTESLILYLFSAVLGLLVAGLSLEWLSVPFEETDKVGVPYWWQYEIDARSLFILFSASFGLWIFVSFLLGLKYITFTSTEALSQAGRTGVKANASGVERYLLIFQIVISSLILHMAMEVIADLSLLKNSNYRINAKDILTGHLILPPAQYPSRVSQVEFLEGYSEHVCQLEALDICTYASVVPGPFLPSTQVEITNEEFDFSKLDDFQNPYHVLVGLNYFETLGIEIIEGRSFNEKDTANSTQVTIIPEDLARRLWPSESAIGKTLLIKKDGESKPLLVVGVSKDATFGLRMHFQFDNHGPLFRPMIQSKLADQLEPSVFVVAFKTTGDPASHTEDVSRETLNFNREILIDAHWPLEVRWEHLVGPFIVQQSFIIPPALLSLIVIFFSTYSLCRRIIQLSRQEIGIRRALGATNGQIFTYLLFRYGKPVLIGLIIGVSLITVLEILKLSWEHVLLSSSLRAILIIIVLAAICLLAWTIPIKNLLQNEPANDLHCN